MTDGRLGRIILLNGTSSSGKTTLVHALQSALPDPWLEIGIDRFVFALPGCRSAGGSGRRTRCYSSASDARLRSSSSASELGGTGPSGRRRRSLLFIHQAGGYDIEVDTSLVSPNEAAGRIVALVGRREAPGSALK